jgi:hypothetical protein
VTVTLVNTDPVALRDVVVQAGMFGEHQFVAVEIADAAGRILQQSALDSRWYGVVLAPLCGAVCTFRVARYRSAPSYATPWQDAATDHLHISPRRIDGAS